MTKGGKPRFKSPFATGGFSGISAAAVVSALLLGVGLGACGEARGGGPPPDTAASISVVDDAGRTVTLYQPATRIVSLLPAATETLLALGGAELLVARTEYDHDLRLARLPSVGGGLTPSIEALANLRPDLVIAWEEAGAARVRPRLEDLGIAVFAVQTQDTTAIFSNIQRLGQLIGREAVADSVALRVRAGLDSIRASVAGRSRPTVLYVVGIDPPMTAGPNTFISQLIEVAGGRTAFPDVSANWAQVSLEDVVRRRPEVLIVPTDDEAIAMERLRNAAGWRELLADDRTRVLMGPADLLNRPSPGIVETARFLRDAIHPDAASAQP